MGLQGIAFMQVIWEVCRKMKTMNCMLDGLQYGVFQSKFTDLTLMKNVPSQPVYRSEKAKFKKSIEFRYALLPL